MPPYLYGLLSSLIARRPLPRETTSMFLTRGDDVKNDFSTPTPSTILRNVMDSRDKRPVFNNQTLETLNTSFFTLANFLVNTYHQQ